MVTHLTFLPMVMASAARASTNIDFPVPCGPHNTRLLWVFSHRKVMRSSRSLVGIVDRAGLKFARVTPVGKPALVRFALSAD